MDASTERLSLEQIVETLSEPLLRYLRRYVGNAALAEDLLQETLIRIARGLPTFAGCASPRTWAFTIATRVAADHFRRPGNRAQIVDVEETAQQPDGERAVDEQLVIDEMNACIRRVIDSLPEDYRAALILHDLEGMAAAQTAEICGCSLATAKMRIHRGRLRLKEALQQQCCFYRDSDNVLRCDRK